MMCRWSEEAGSEDCESVLGTFGARGLELRIPCSWLRRDNLDWEEALVSIELDLFIMHPSSASDGSNGKVSDGAEDCDSPSFTMPPVWSTRWERSDSDMGSMYSLLGLGTISKGDCPSLRKSSDPGVLSFRSSKPPQYELAAVLAWRLIAALVGVVDVVSSPVDGLGGNWNMELELELNIGACLGGEGSWWEFPRGRRWVDTGTVGDKDGWPTAIESRNSLGS